MMLSSEIVKKRHLLQAQMVWYRNRCQDLTVL